MKYLEVKRPDRLILAMPQNLEGKLAAPGKLAQQ